MRIVFDQGVPAPLRNHLPGHTVQTAHELGWSTLRNGDLLNSAELKFDALVTTDRNFRYQQNFAGRRLAILILPTTSWPRLQLHIEQITEAIASLEAGQHLELSF